MISLSCLVALTSIQMEAVGKIYVIRVLSLDKEIKLKPQCYEVQKRKDEMVKLILLTIQILDWDQT